MTSHHHEDPAAESAARAAQLAAMALSITEGIVRLRTERLAAKTADDERTAAADRAQARAEHATAWLQNRTGPAANAAQAASLGPAPDAGRVAVTIICTPRDLADQAFPVPMPDAMATATQAAGRVARTPGRPLALPAATPRPGPTPSHGPGGVR